MEVPIYSRLSGKRITIAMDYYNLYTDSLVSAMNSDMGSLALGELVGAAAFIVSVVAG